MPCPIQVVTRHRLGVKGDHRIVATLLSALHVLALGLGLGSVFMRGRYMRTLHIGFVQTGDSSPG